MKFSVFVQTDKPIYKPDDLLRFRVFLLDSTTRPYTSKESVNVSIYDPADNLIKQWSNVTIKNGTFQTDFQMSSAVTGDWLIKVFVENQVSRNC